MVAWKFGLIEIRLEPRRNGRKRIGKDHGTTPGHWLLVNPAIQLLALT
jgi:hypothetical protein